MKNQQGIVTRYQIYFSTVFRLSLFSLLAICISIFSSCKPKQKDIASSAKSEQTTKTEPAINPVPGVVNEPSAVTGKTIGKVSHEYRATGCSTVIVVVGATKPLILIPKNKLSADIDVDGLEITFNYRTLKMPQPAGCTKGIPAELSDIAKK